jgi:hypothetical protein
MSPSTGQQLALQIYLYAHRATRQRQPLKRLTSGYASTDILPGQVCAGQRGQVGRSPSQCPILGARREQILVATAADVAEGLPAGHRNFALRRSPGLPLELTLGKVTYLAVLIIRRNGRRPDCTARLPVQRRSERNQRSEAPRGDAGLKARHGPHRCQLPLVFERGGSLSEKGFD